MNQFTTEQMRRMRCTLETWRTNLYTVDNGSCDNSDLALEAGDNPSICAGGSVTMDATPSGGAGGYSYSWEPTTGLSSPDVADPVASPTQTTVYTVTVTDNNGCEATDTVTVEVIPNDTAQSYPSWQDPNNYQGTYDLDDNGIINILDILALVNFCAP